MMPTPNILHRLLCAALVSAMLVATLSTIFAAQDDTPAGLRARVPGVIVTSPVSDLNQNHLVVAATFVVTGEIIPGSWLRATATVPSGATLALSEFMVEPTSSGRLSAENQSVNRGITVSGGQTSYPLTGFGLPVPSLPVGSTVEVKIIPPTVRGTTAVLRMTTGSFIRGYEQSADRMTLKFFGAFTPEIPVSVLFGLWPMSVAAEAVTVSSEAITVDLSKDAKTASWVSDFYPVTILQQNQCDTVMVRFESPIEVRQ